MVRALAVSIIAVSTCYVFAIIFCFYAIWSGSMSSNLASVVLSLIGAVCIIFALMFLLYLTSRAVPSVDEVFIVRDRIGGVGYVRSYTVLYTDGSTKFLTEEQWVKLVVADPSLMRRFGHMRVMRSS
jgi:glucan phosphoethanolaminetransferase (alkaline phosphatase superfamily)